MVAHEIALPTETVFGFEAPPIRFGLGASADVGRELSRLGVRRTLIVTDKQLEATGLPARVGRYARAAGADVAIWSGAVTEPTDRSIEAALNELAVEQIDGYVAVGAAV